MRGRTGFWLAVAAAAALFGGGLTIAYLGYAKTSGPDDAVRGYYSALQRGDAPDALAFGTVPRGPKLLLTSTVLTTQQRIAPIRDFSIVSTARHGRHATVRVRYTLGFVGGAQPQQDDVDVVRSGDTWRLAQSAIATQLDLPAAALRATIERAGVPQGTVLMFPGALPLSFDSPYLELAPATAAVSFATGSQVHVTTRVSRAGKHAVVRKLVRMIKKCLTAGPGDPTGCPAPAEGYVPGTLRGRLVGHISKQLIVLLEPDASGRVDVSGRIKVRGRYQRLTFTNQPRTVSGRFVLETHASGYAVRPVRLGWEAST